MAASGSSDCCILARLRLRGRGGYSDLQERGQLIVSELRANQFSERPLGPGNLHIYDYDLFFDNVAENAARRIESFRP